MITSSPFSTKLWIALKIASLAPLVTKISWFGFRVWLFFPCLKMGEKNSESFSLKTGWPWNNVYWLNPSLQALSRLSIKNVGASSPGVPWQRLIELYFYASWLNSDQMWSWSLALRGKVRVTNCFIFLVNYQG